MITSLFQKTIEVLSEDAVYCLACVLFGHKCPQKASRVKNFYSQPFRHWPAAVPACKVRRITKPPTTDHRPTGRCSIDPTTTETDHWLTDRSSTDPPITDSPTHRPYYNWPTTLWLTNLILTESPLDQFLSTTNFNSSFGMGTTYYWIGKTIYKMTDKKELW